MAMSGQFQLAAGEQMLLAAHTQSTGLDNSSKPYDLKAIQTAAHPVRKSRSVSKAAGRLRGGGLMRVATL
jgi:hypothetical protein